MLLHAALLALLLTVAGQIDAWHDAVAPVAPQALARDLAASMAQYRSAVMAYHSLHPGAGAASVDLTTLRADGLLASWSSATGWSNYRGADGTVFIYGDGADRAAVIADLMHLSQRSALVGHADLVNARFVSELRGATAIALPAPVLAALGQGGVLWLANAN